MAVNKTISANGSRGHHKFTLTVNEDSTSGNSSYLSYSFKLSPVSNGWNWYGFGSDVKYTVTINGVNYTGSIDSYDGRSTVTLKSGSNIEVAHNSDGTKTINISFSVTDTSGSPYPPGNASASDTLTLTALHKDPTASLTSITERNSSLSGVANNVIVNYLSVKRFVLSYQVYDGATISTDGVEVFEQGLSRLPATVTVGTSTITVDVDFRNSSLLTSSLESGKTKILFFIVDSKNGRYPLNTPEYSVIAYQKPNLVQTSSNVKRNGQTTGKGKLNLTGTFYNANVGNTTNTISLSYKYWRSDTTEPSDSSYISIPSSANVGTGNNITISGWGLKNGNTEITNLNQNYAYKFKIRAVDTFSNSHIIELVLSKGLWIMAKFKDRVDFLNITVGGNKVVDSGTNYIKYYDGTMICWGSSTTATLSWTQDASIWYVRDLTLPDFAQTFISPPMVTKTIQSMNTSGRNINICGNSAPTTTNPGTYNLDTYWNATGTTVTVTYIAIGKWK